MSSSHPILTRTLEKGFLGAPFPLLLNEEGDRVVVLGHGAGSNSRSVLLEKLAGALSEAGNCVVRFDFSYRREGRSFPPRAEALVPEYRQVCEWARSALSARSLAIGGVSMGGRVASLLAAEGYAVDGVLLFAYPLHPAGRTSQLRDAHLQKISVPVLCLSGTQDPLCERPLMEQVLARLPDTFTMHWLEGADHSFKVKRATGRTGPEVMREVITTATEWLNQI